MAVVGKKKKKKTMTEWNVNVNNIQTILYGIF